jgi:5S rRNA maturation endonuclease (ribonuclease M5)
VEALWAACRSPALADGAPHDPYRWLLARKFDPLRVAHLDLARTLPTGAPCPPWASWWRKPWWDAGYRFLMPAYDARGALAGLIARWCGVEECPEKGWRKVSPPDGWPKSLNGKGGSPRGLAFANPTGRWLLARGPEARPGEGEPAWNGAVLLVEGHTDLVRLATAADADSSAVLGYVSGSWTPELAGRLPSVARVVVLPDSDPSGKGEEMAEKVVRTLGELDSAPRVVTADALRAHLERSRNG